ncbi:SDR family NAD(P)-dependent oxidoreductase [Oricola cellulosilytica]|uniref:SDR family NAD(P)-dependent oxidoreductase n=1 Tax=Oricola cellulosilytica TaxID=1429082 RepID=A0A4R0PEV8_9HYPH|nr:SDR family NAD(P)-dependent oxidoreductase [Oricola cellulosilytica]TCD14915.1 SDR family NAD(P)-dependent oxidoreductase [Oricola cellulosilytica]
MKLDSSISAVVTGGASGLGAATAKALADKGCMVALFDMNEEAGKAKAAELGAVFVKVDVSDPESVARGFEHARQINGPEQILVNCAGIAPAAKTVSRGLPHDPALFMKAISVNLGGTFNCASTAAAGMAATDPRGGSERGVIINTASVAAYDGQIGQIAYSASKGGVVGMTLPMARDLAQHGIRVMTIAPGIMKTPMLEGMPQDVQDALGAQVPFPARLGEPAEYAALAIHICENQMLNGEVIRLDGAIRMAPR